VIGFKCEFRLVRKQSRQLCHGLLQCPKIARRRNMFERSYPGHKDYELHRALGLPVSDIPPFVSPLSADEKNGLINKASKLRLEMINKLGEFPALQPQIQELKLNITSEDLARGTKSSVTNAIAKKLFTANDGQQSDDELSKEGYISRERIKKAVEELMTMARTLRSAVAEETGAFVGNSYYD